jgi:hypothetical protein
MSGFLANRQHQLQQEGERGAMGMLFSLRLRKTPYLGLREAQRHICFLSLCTAVVNSVLLGHNM